MAIGNPPLTMQSLQYFVIAKIIIFNFISATTYTHIFMSLTKHYCKCKIFIFIVNAVWNGSNKIMQLYACNNLIFGRPKLLLQKIKYLKNRCSCKHNFFTKIIITEQPNFSNDIEKVCVNPSVYSFKGRQLQRHHKKK